MRGSTTALAGLALGAILAVPLRAAQPDAVNRARRLDVEGKHEAAIAVYQQVLARTPDSFEAHYGIARALDLAGKYDEARRHFSRAIELAPEGTKDQALRMMGVSYTFVSNATEAAKYFRAVIDRRVAAGNHAGAAEVANELGRVYLELNDLDNALKWYRFGFDTAARETGRSAWETDLAEMRLAHAQARVAARKGNATEARRYQAVVRSSLDKRTNSDQEIQYPYLVGYIDFYLKDYTGAIAALEKADQGDPFILLLLAQAYEQAGNAASARTYYQKVLASTSHAVSNAFARPIARRRLESTR